MVSRFVPGSCARTQLHTEIELSLSCRNLPKMDILSMSDPMCVTYTRPFGKDKWIEYHRTECVSNCHDPDFTSKIVMPYRFEEQQLLRFDVYDVDDGSSNLDNQDFIGTASCTLGQVVASGKVKLALTDRGNTDHGQRGFLLINAEQVSNERNDLLTFKFSGHNLDKKDWFGLSDPFLEIYKATESGDYILVHKTEAKKWTLNPKWAEFKLTVHSLCNGDDDRDLKVQCYDWNWSGNHSFIGEFHTNLRTLKLNRGPQNCYKLINSRRQAEKGSLKESGFITLDYFRLEPIYTFLDYIKGGTKLNCSIAIDFTASNGDPSDPVSLHYTAGVRQNCYEQAILEVVSIIQDYDSDKAFPVLGFGARLPPNGSVSHEFFVNMSPSNPYCYGVSGVLEAYRTSLRQIQLYGPTNFAPVIRHVTQFAQTYQDGSRYFILLILTDGVITDMNETTNAIVAASTLPLSIVIVGVGDADFSAMEQLDADKVALCSQQGVKAARDIVQFVPFNKFIACGSPHTARKLLAKEVLAEIPTQLVGFMKSNNIPPNPPCSEQIVLPPDPDRLNL
ncbi:hypothetical protein LSTR_LSTR004420 [Laodelphax striatellus]|uniref:Copine-3 n=1 Tax=Laodelphax striatellus TaxID=195883 RepID=A0A482XB36_LAOST|nr:hypothetical protein LSTR_LSTR004420 [Laodelphax striatellus]